MNEIWIRLRNGHWNRFWTDGESYYVYEEDDDSGINYYITDDYGNLIPVFFQELTNEPSQPITDNVLYLHS